MPGNLSYRKVREYFQDKKLTGHFSILTSFFFLSKNLKDNQNWNVSVLLLKWTQTMEMYVARTDSFPWDISKPYIISSFVKKYLSINDFQNQHFAVLWLKWTQTMKMRQNKIFS